MDTNILGGEFVLEKAPMYSIKCKNTRDLIKK